MAKERLGDGHLQQEEAPGTRNKERKAKQKEKKSKRKIHREGDLTTK